MHCTLHDRVLRFGVHHVKDAMDHFISARTENCCAHKLLAVAIDENLDEAVGFTFFNGSAHPGHRTLADEQISS